MLATSLLLLGPLLLAAPDEPPSSPAVSAPATATRAVTEAAAEGALGAAVDPMPTESRWAPPDFEPLGGESLRAALLFDGEQNYRPVVQYSINVRLEPASKMLRAKAKVTWKNDGSYPVSVLWWHLYLNAFRNEASTFVRQSGGRLGEGGEDDWGWTEVLSATARSLAQTGTTASARHDLLATARFESPDDGNPDDRTVWVTPLPFAVGPGERVEIDLEWKAKLPKVHARTGHAGSFFIVGQWFPKLGVLEESFRGAERDYAGEPKWNCHQFHANTEFFADYGSYRVKITVPNDYIVGATGQRVEDPVKDDGWTTYEYYQDRVHDFAWTADSRFVIRRFTFDPKAIAQRDRVEAAATLGLSPDDLRLTPVEVTMLLQPEHRRYAPRYRDAVEQSLKWFGMWFGRYPYATLTVVDGPPDGQAAMGMEYPTLITGGVEWPAPPETLDPEMVTIHELGHQFWYGLVASNEFEEAWLDEGLTEFSTGVLADRVYGPSSYAFLLGVPLTPWMTLMKMTERDRAIIGNIELPDTDAIGTSAWMFRDRYSYGLNTYRRPQLVLLQLAEMIGMHRVLRGLRIYQQRWRYRHPTAADLQAVLEEVSGRSLGPFFDRIIHSAERLDYALVELRSSRVEPPAGIFDRLDGGHRVATTTTAATSTEPTYRTELVIERRGGLQLPVTVEVTMAAGPPYRARWDGVDRWHRVVFEEPRAAVSARLYVETARPLDARPSNDTITIEPNDVGATWFARTLYWMQSILQLVGGLL